MRSQSSSEPPTMEVLFARSTKIGSILIQEVTKEDCSHCAILDSSISMVVHSSFGGVARLPLKDFLAGHTIVHRVRLGIELNEAKIPFGASYDYAAFLYLGLKFLLMQIGIKLPKVNLLNISGAFICTELVSLEVLGAVDSTITPHQLYEKLKPLEIK